MLDVDMFVASWVKSQRRPARRAPGKGDVAEDVAALGLEDDFLRTLPADFVEAAMKLRARFAAVVDEYVDCVKTGATSMDEAHELAVDLLIESYNLCADMLGLFRLFISAKVQTEVEVTLRKLLRGAVVTEAGMVVESRVDAGVQCTQALQAPDTAAARPSRIPMLQRSALHVPPSYRAPGGSSATATSAPRHHDHASRFKRLIGSHVLLTGMRGVGKTTIMRAVQVALALLSRRIFPVYIDYEAERNERAPAPVRHLSDIIIQRADAAGFDTFNMMRIKDGMSRLSIASVMDDLKWQGAVLGVLVDELQLVYEQQHAAYGGEIVSDVLRIGRERLEMAVISGSSHSVADLAFKRVRNSWNVHYPDLNNSVYREWRLHPLSKENFAQLAPELQIAASNIDEFFSLTGGVGRYIHQLDQHGKSDDAQWYTDFDRAYDANGLFAHIVGMMLGRNAEEIGIADIKEIGIADIKRLHGLVLPQNGVQGDTDAVAVGRLVDDSLLCPTNSSGTTFRLLLPGALRHLARRDVTRQDANLSQKMILGFRSALCYWEGSGSAAGFCEAPLRQWLCTARPALRPFQFEYLHVGTPLVLRSAKLSSSSQTRAIDGLSELDGLYGLIAETGLDGIRVATQAVAPAQGMVRASALNPTFNVDLLQIKLSAVDSNKTLTAGHHFTGNLADNGTQLRAMIGAACAGFRKILQTLPETSAERTSAHYNIAFRLLTNRKVNKDVNSFMLNGATQREVLAHFRKNCTTKIDSVAFDLVAGDDFGNIIPDNARSVIAVRGL